MSPGTVCLLVRLENQGGGIAPLRRNGTPALIANDGRHPPAQNDGYYRTLALDMSQPATGNGNFCRSIRRFAVHAALLPHEKYSSFAAQAAVPHASTRREFGNMVHGISRAWFWDHDTFFGVLVVDF